METRLLYPITTATNVLVKTGFFKNKTLALVIELLRQNSGGGGNTEPSEPEEIPEGITDFSQAPSDNVVYEGDDYPKGAYTRVTLDQGILYSDLKFVLYSHPFDVYTISQNVVINRVDATINNDITFGEIESFTSPTVWVPQFDNFKSSLPLSTKAIADGDKTYTFRKIQDSPLGKFGYWTDSQEYYSLPEMPVCIFKYGSNLYINIPETLIKTDIGDDIILTQSDLEDCYDGFLPAAEMAILKYKGIDLGELDNLIVEIPTKTGTTSKKFTELNPVELHNYLSTLNKGEKGLLMSLLTAITELYTDEIEPVSNTDVIFLIQGSYVVLLTGFHADWWVSSGAMTGNPNVSTIPLVTNKQDASRYESCLIYNKADGVTSIGLPVVVLSLLGEMESTLLLDYFPFSLNDDAVGCVVILHDVYAVLQSQQSSDLYWVDTDQRYPLRSEDYESIFSQVASGNISLYITRTLYISDGELWNAVGSVDLSDVYSRISSVESSVSDVNSSVESLQSIVYNMKSIQYLQIDIFNTQDPEYTIENLLYPTLYYVNCGVQPIDSYDQRYDYKQALLAEITIKVENNSEYTTFNAPVKGEFLVIPYYYSNPASYYSGVNKNAIIGINFPIKKDKITLPIKNSINLCDTFTLTGGILELKNITTSPIVVYLTYKYSLEYSLYSSYYDEPGSKSGPITIGPEETLEVKKILYEKTPFVANSDSDDNEHTSTITIAYAPVVETHDSNDEVFTVNGVSFKMIPVAGGLFQMGSSEEAHPVRVSDYYIGETEVTLDLYKAVMGSNAVSPFRSGYAAYNLTWDLCQTFINTLNQTTGKYFRFLTEAEWEYAARGGNKSRGYKYSGSMDPYETALQPVKYASNELGICDMSNNVLEWCYDNYKAYERIPVGNPTGPLYGTERVVRGGGYSSTHEFTKVYTRWSEYPLVKSNDIGLRLAASYLSQNTFTVDNVTFTMVNVQGGQFTMGQEDDEHDVILDDFSIGLVEVTQALWEAVTGSNPSTDIGSNKPVANVSWYDCQNFISLLNTITGEEFRLPTEAEWEYAAKGGNLSLGYLYSGSNTASEVANYTQLISGSRRAHAVATKHPNELGIYDMSGNVWELCSTYYSGSAHVAKGGSYNGEAINGEITHRVPGGTTNTGFRLACTNLSDTTITVGSTVFTMIFVEGNDNINSFYIGQTEVTVGLWNAVTLDGLALDAQLPIYGKTYDEYIDFITQLNNITNLEFRLPTEGEWEYAASGGTLSHGYTYSGSNLLDDVGWYYNNSYSEDAHLLEVALLQPNELGLYDMSGNVAEWCSDRYGDYEKGEVSQVTLVDPCVINSSNSHSVRGGTVYEREGSEEAGIIGLRLALPIKPNITHSVNSQTEDYWATQNSYGPEVLSVSIPGENIDVGAPNEYTCEIVSGNNWERYGSSGSTFWNQSTTRTPSSPHLTIDDLVLKLTKGINSFIYTIPGREVPVHYPLIIASIPDASVITSDFNISDYLRNSFYSNDRSQSNNISEVHKTCNISIEGGDAYVDNLSKFRIAAPNKSLSQEILLTTSSAFESSAGYLCICTMGMASIKYFGLELLECVLNNATVRNLNTPKLVGAKIYITKNRICEDLTGLDVNITTE